MIVTDKINSFIFRGYDIRGRYPEDLNEDIAYTIGKSYGTYIKKFNQTKCVVGHDNRYSYQELTKALVTGILDTGIDVVYLDLVTTPMYYYSQIKLEIPAGVMVTASHNPKDENGFKFSFDERGNAKGEMIEEFRDFTLEGNYDDGLGELSSYNIKNDYFKLFKQSLNFGNRRLKVVLDPGNGTTTCILKELYENFPIDIDIICGESDPTFPNHHPDPCVEKNLDLLKKRVLETNADLGLGFDGDGDRLGIIDENGNYIATDKYMVVIIRDIFDKVENKKFLYDVKCSKIIEDEITRLGGKSICYRTGNSYTKAKVKEADLPFGGELSGHVYFRDRWPGFDSGLYAGLRLLELLSKTDKKTSQLLDGITNYYSTEEIKISSPDKIKFTVVDKVVEYCKDKGYDINTIDGVRATFKDGWALVRCSNTGPNITVRFESETQERLEEIQQEFLSKIEEYNKE